jgi:hypothetical protein
LNAVSRTGFGSFLGSLIWLESNHWLDKYYNLVQYILLWFSRRWVCFYVNIFQQIWFFLKDDHKLGPRAKRFRVRLCDWPTKKVSVVYIFRLLLLKKAQHVLRLLQYLPPKMSVIGVPHSVSVDLKSNANLIFYNILF